MVSDEQAVQVLLPLSVLIDRVTRSVYAESASFGFCIFRDSEDVTLFWVTGPAVGSIVHATDDADVYQQVGLIAATAFDWCLKSGCL